MQSFLFFFLLVASVWAKTTGLVFHRKVDDKFIPLTIAPYENFSFFSIIPSKEHIPDFSFDQGSVSTHDEPNAGDAGFYGPILAFGPRATAARFELDDFGMIIKPKLFGCRDSKGAPANLFASYAIAGTLCDPAEVYLLPRDAGNNHH